MRSTAKTWFLSCTNTSWSPPAGCRPTIRICWVRIGATGYRMFENRQGPRHRHHARCHHLRLGARSGTAQKRRRGVGYEPDQCHWLVAGRASFMHGVGANQMADEFIKDLTEGFRGTNIKAGMLKCAAGADVTAPLRHGPSGGTCPFANWCADYGCLLPDWPCGPTTNRHLQKGWTWEKLKSITATTPPTLNICSGFWTRLFSGTRSIPRTLGQPAYANRDPKAPNGHGLRRRLCPLMTASACTFITNSLMAALPSSTTSTRATRISIYSCTGMLSPNCKSLVPRTVTSKCSSWITRDDCSRPNTNRS